MDRYEALEARANDMLLHSPTVDHFKGLNAHLKGFKSGLSGHYLKYQRQLSKILPKVIYCFFFEISEKN